MTMIRWHVRVSFALIVMQLVIRSFSFTQPICIPGRYQRRSFAPHSLPHGFHLRSKAPMEGSFRLNGSYPRRHAGILSGRGLTEKVRLMQSYFQGVKKSFRRKVVGFALAMIFFLSTTFPAFAGTGGRVGGSFGPSSRSSHSSSAGSSLSGYRSRSWGGPTIQYNMGPRVILQARPYSPQVYVSSFDTPLATHFRTSDIVLLATTGALLAYGFTKHHQDKSSSPLGPGATAASITLHLEVPNRDDPNNILETLKRVSRRVDTNSRKGVQDMVTESTCQSD